MFLWNTVIGREKGTRHRAVEKLPSIKRPARHHANAYQTVEMRLVCLCSMLERQHRSL